MPSNENDMLRTAIKLHLSNEFQAALDIYSSIINNDSSNYHALHLLGMLLIQNGYIVAGKNHINRSIQICGSYPEAVENLSMFENLAAAKVRQEMECVPEKYIKFNKEDNTVGAWRQHRMFDFVHCFTDKNDTWLTLGDSRGNDSNWLKKLGIEHVVASSLDVSLLEFGHEIGDVGEYLSINAENIMLDDNSFDYVLCKEALHHMPRPMLAIYEMLRIARKGIVFIEPQDRLIDWRAANNKSFYREIIDDSLVGSKISYKRCDDDQEIMTSYIDWWEDGAFNYVYTFSKREIRKISLGTGLPSFATKCFNDHYNDEWCSQPATPDSDGFKKMKEQIELHDLACANIGKPYSYITGILFKQTPQPSVANHLKEIGYEFEITRTRFLPIKWPKID